MRKIFAFLMALMMVSAGFTNVSAANKQNIKVYTLSNSEVCNTNLNNLSENIKNCLENIGGGVINNFSCLENVICNIISCGGSNNGGGNSDENIENNENVNNGNQGSTENDGGTNNNSSIHQFEKRVLELVNEERAKHGLNALIWSDELSNVARAHSKDMNDRGFFSHNNPDGKTPFDRISENGIKYMTAAENIAMGQATPEAVMRSWMNSEGHRKNILNAKMKYLGVGFYQANGKSAYWTQCFIG